MQFNSINSTRFYSNVLYKHSNFNSVVGNFESKIQVACSVSFVNKFCGQIYYWQYTFIDLEISEQTVIQRAWSDLMLTQNINTAISVERFLLLMDNNSIQSDTDTAND